MCKQCDEKPVYEFTNQKKLCKGCFTKYFLKKVFYTLRKFKMIEQGEKVYYTNDRGFRDVVLEDILEKVSCMFLRKSSELDIDLKYETVSLNVFLVLELFPCGSTSFSINSTNC